MYAILVLRRVLPLRLQCFAVQWRLSQQLDAGVCGTAPVQAVQQLHLVHRQRCMSLGRDLMTVVSMAGNGMLRNGSSMLVCLQELQRGLLATLHVVCLIPAYIFYLSVHALFASCVAAGCCALLCCSCCVTS